VPALFGREKGVNFLVHHSHRLVTIIMRVSRADGSKAEVVDMSISDEVRRGLTLSWGPDASKTAITITISIGTNQAVLRCGREVAPSPLGGYAR
jgi:hypothetical protein